MKMLANESEFRVKVAVRVRPFLQREKNHEQKSCVTIHPQTNQIILGDRRTFKYDFVFGPKTLQEELYRTSVEPMLTNVFDGYNVTIFAYGQTGSGKTYTMTGGNILSIGEKDFGIVPRAVKTIFDTIRNRKDSQITISASYLEIYKDDIIDLLGVNDKDLDVRDDAAGNTIVIGASEHTCHSIEDVVGLLKKGSNVRHTGATQMNDESSRSHAIFTLYIEQRLRDKNSTNVQASFDGLVKPLQSTFDESYLSAKLHFVDLAGSERVARTQNTGERFQESIRINSGLLALGNVVSALSDPKKRTGGHIPYRDSKITRLLKDSLGGNAKTLMITCVSPCTADLDESLNALKYAHRASQIRNKPIKNVDPNAQRFIEMQSEITYLREELARQRTVISHDGQSLSGRKSSGYNSNDHSRRLIQTAFVCFQQLNECEDLTNEQKQWIHTWMDAFSNENSEELFSDILTSRVSNLESALHSAKDELKSESQIRAKRDMTVDRLQEQLKVKEDELNRMRNVLDESSYHISTTKKSLPDRTKSAPHFNGIHKKEQSIQPRTIHSSPAAFDMDYVVERFHGRSLALAHSQEEIEELDLRDSNEKLTDERKFTRRGTYRLRKNRMTPTILQEDETLQALAQSTINKQKLIEEATRNVREAESKAQDLSINIQLKEQLIKSVYASTKDVKDTNDQYEQHIKMLEKEVDKAKTEYHDLQKAMQQIATKTTSEKSKLETEYRKKCDMAKARLESLQQKEKQYRDLMSKLSGNSEKRISDLQAALFRMKQQYETAQKRIREEAELKNKVEQELIREQQRIQELTIQCDQQKKISKLKTEGLAAAQRKLRGAPNGNTNDGMTTPTTAIAFEVEMEKIVAERQGLEILRDDIQKREELIQKRELLLNERTELEAKKLRTSQVLNKSLKSINDKLKTIDKQQPDHQTTREQLLKQKRLFTERLEQQDCVLSPTEERRLIEIDEAIEAIELAIDYQKNLITKRERDVQQSIRASQGPDSPLFKISQLNDNESKELCRKLFEKVIDLKEGDNKNRRQFEEIKSQLQEQSETINELQSRLQASTLDADRRLTSVQQTHEEEKQLFLGQLQESANQIKELERDLYFYKHKTRELRKSMATSTTSALDGSTTTGIARRKDSNSIEDDFPTQVPTPRTAVQQYQSAPFLLKIGNRSNSSHQIQPDDNKKR
ncbi:unnamed protein product [Adineta steineri]|uniref:Kinesin motor domain-containing protein n=1 Tax=Adineta steineri TaxID=433720 RepID=A0A813XYX5_9BILA|nr:unnamed protein product [Adineta steineri]CAF3590697.1 unnamed protein product [Adineta steineri]